MPTQLSLFYIFIMLLSLRNSNICIVEKVSASFSFAFPPHLLYLSSSNIIMRGERHLISLLLYIIQGILMRKKHIIMHALHKFSSLFGTYTLNVGLQRRAHSLTLCNIGLLSSMPKKNPEINM